MWCEQVPLKFADSDEVPSLHSAICADEDGFRPRSQPQAPVVCLAQLPAGAAGALLGSAVGAASGMAGADFAGAGFVGAGLGAAAAGADDGTGSGSGATTGASVGVDAGPAAGVVTAGFAPVVAGAAATDCTAAVVPTGAAAVVGSQADSARTAATAGNTLRRCLVTKGEPSGAAPAVRRSRDH